MIIVRKQSPYQELRRLFSYYYFLIKSTIKKMSTKTRVASVIAITSFEYKIPFQVYM